MLVPSFEKVGGADKTLGDFQIVSGNATALAFGNNSLVIFGAYGDPQFIVDDTTLEDNFPAAYAKFSADEEAELAFTYVDANKHWYMTVDTAREYPMDAYPMVQGRGYILTASRLLAKGCKLTVSGEVVKEAFIAEVAKSEYMLTGNVMPAAQKLKDFIMQSGNATALVSGNNKLVMFGAYGDPQFIIDDTTLEDNFPEAYAKFSEDEEAELAFTYVDSDKHWYMSVDTGREYPMDEYPIQAGQGFILTAGRLLAKGCSLTVPAVVE